MPTKSKKEPKAPEWLFANIAEASKNARKIYFLYIGFLFYCAFTVFGTPDRYIILNEKIKMPILNIDIPLIGFMLMAPLAAIFLFVYLQMYLGRLKWLIDLSTKYAPIERGRLYPWMLNFPKDPERGFSKGLQKIIIKFSLWGLLPLVLGLFAYWSLKTHNLLICYVDGIATIIGAIAVLIFWCRYERVQRKVLKFITKNLGKLLLTLIMFLFGFVFLFHWIPMSISGDLFRLDLSYEKLITEPIVDYEEIYWGRFAEIHLEGAILNSTILKRADLRRAQLRKAKIQYANLERANLRGANLLEANLRGANLRGADLGGANLRGADLSRRANLRGARLEGADLGGADLGGARLEGANLIGARLEGARLLGANLLGANLNGARNLTIEQLSEVRTLYQAKLDPELEKQIKEKLARLLEKPYWWKEE